MEICYSCGKPDQVLFRDANGLKLCAMHCYPEYVQQLFEYLGEFVGASRDVVRAKIAKVILSYAKYGGPVPAGLILCHYCRSDQIDWLDGSTNLVQCESCGEVFDPAMIPERRRR